MISPHQRYMQFIGTHLSEDPYAEFGMHMNDVKIQFLNIIDEKIMDWWSYRIAIEFFKFNARQSDDVPLFFNFDKSGMSADDIDLMAIFREFLSKQFHWWYDAVDIWQICIWK